MLKLLETLEACRDRLKAEEASAPEAVKIMLQSRVPLGEHDFPCVCIYPAGVECRTFDQSSVNAGVMINLAVMVVGENAISRVTELTDWCLNGVFKTSRLGNARLELADVSPGWEGEAALDLERMIITVRAEKRAAYPTIAALDDFKTAKVDGLGHPQVITVRKE